MQGEMGAQHCLHMCAHPCPHAPCAVAAADLDSGAVTQLATGHDFFSSPALSPDGSQLAFVAWDHPNMVRRLGGGGHTCDNSDKTLLVSVWRHSMK